MAVAAVKDFIRSFTDPLDKVADEIASKSNPYKSGGVSNIPDTTSKVAIEKNAEKNGVVAWLTSWFLPQNAIDAPNLNKVTEPLPIQPQLPYPTPAARKLIDMFCETNIRTWLAQETLSESDNHKLLIALFLAQKETREEAARSQQNRLNGYRQQLKATQVTQQMLTDDIKSSAKNQQLVDTIHKVCSTVALSAFALSSIAFVVTVTGGTALPVLSWISANTALTTGFFVVKGTAGAAAGVTQAAGTYLQQQSDKTEAALTASLHQSDTLDLEMKALRQWWTHVFSSISSLSSNVREVVQKTP